MELRKPRFIGKKTKWEKRRIARRFARTAKGKKPLVEPLTIAPVQERQAAFKKGKMVFYDGNERIELPLSKEKKGRLIGVYKAGSEIATFRTRSVEKAISGVMIETRPVIEIYKLEKNAGGFFETSVVGRLSTASELGHMTVSGELRGRGLGLKGASIAERHVRALQEGKHGFKSFSQFARIFEKLGYKEKGSLIQPTYDPTSGGLTAFTYRKIHHMEKSGKFQPKDDLNKFYRIEAIDPKTGKARIFTFPIQKTSGK